MIVKRQLAGLRGICNETQHIRSWRPGKGSLDPIMPPAADGRGVLQTCPRTLVKDSTERLIKLPID